MAMSRASGRREGLTRIMMVAGIIGALWVLRDPDLQKQVLGAVTDSAVTATEAVDATKYDKVETGPRRLVTVSNAPEGCNGGKCGGTNFVSARASN
jgi:hypothetical protein